MTRSLVLNISFLTSSCLLFLCNQWVLKPLTTGPLHLFFAWYFNDILAGCLILAFTNFLLCAACRRPLDTLGRIAPFILACGVAWELLPLLYKPWGVFDWLDFTAYFVGAALYYFVGRITKLLRTV